MAKVLLSLFTNEQIAAIYRTCRSNSLESLALSDTERVSESMPPAIMGFLSGNGYNSAQDAKELAWGFATIQYGTLGRPKDRNWWSKIYEQAFGLSETYANAIAARIETDDKIEGIVNKALDFLRRAYNFVVPEGIEISQGDKFDVDGMWEMQLAGRQTVELAKRAYSGLSSVRNGVLSGTIFDLLSRAEEGDIEEGDVDTDDYLEAAGDLYCASNRLAASQQKEQGLVAPLLGMGAKAIVAKAATGIGKGSLLKGLRRAGTLAGRMRTNSTMESVRDREIWGKQSAPNATVGAAIGTGVKPGWLLRSRRRKQQEALAAIARADAASANNRFVDQEDVDFDDDMDTGDVSGYDAIPTNRL